MSMRPDAFERLAQRLLREADFDSVNVTGQSEEGRDIDRFAERGGFGNRIFLEYVDQAR